MSLMPVQQLTAFRSLLHHSVIRAELFGSFYFVGDTTVTQSKNYVFGAIYYVYNETLTNIVS